MPAQFLLLLVKVKNFIQVSLLLCELKSVCSSLFDFQPGVDFIKRQLDGVLPKKWFQIRTSDVFIFQKFAERARIKFT